MMKETKSHSQASIHCTVGYNYKSSHQEDTHVKMHEAFFMFFYMFTFVEPCWIIGQNKTPGTRVCCKTPNTISTFVLTVAKLTIGQIYIRLNVGRFVFEIISLTTLYFAIVIVILSYVKETK